MKKNKCMKYLQEYKKPKVELLEFEYSDVIRTSCSDIIPVCGTKEFLDFFNFNNN